MLRPARRLAWRAANRVLRRRRGVTRDQVVWAYRVLLDREPESEHAIRVKMLVHQSVRDLRYEMLSSPEYRQKNALDPNVFVPLDLSKVRVPDRSPGPTRFDRRINKLCDLDDWHGEDWLSIIDRLADPVYRTEKHRKVWEWAQGLYALERLGLLNDSARGLDVGAGVEPVIFYLTTRVGMLHATDIYGEGDFVESAAPAAMLTNPERYATLPCRRDHLTVQRMDGRKLDFPDDSFDFVVCFSSIEHFGGRAAQSQSIREMARVTKPGGAVVITTEVILNGTTHDEYFTPAELEKYLVEASGLDLLEDVDYRLSSETLKHPIDRDHPQALTVRPHVALSQGGVVWTSVCLVLVKP